MMAIRRLSREIFGNIVKKRLISLVMVLLYVTALTLPLN
jgi:hypothetical protein